MESGEIIILGAGLAGLTAAYELASKGIPYIILEARDRIGGRVHTITTDSGATIEMGATWFAEKHTHLMDLITTFDVPYQQQYTGSRVLYDYANPERTARLFELPPSHEAQYLFTDGTQSLLKALYQKLDPNRIRLGQYVQEIAFGEERVTIFTATDELKTGMVISTIPPNLFLNSIQVSPDLPTSIAEVAGKTHTWMGESIKVGLEYTEDFWRSSEIGTIISQFGPAQELHDHRHTGNSGNVLKGFVNPSFHRHGRIKREAKILEQMRFYFGQDLPDAKYFEKDWQSDMCTFNPYATEVTPHQNNGHSALREGYFDNRLYFAGSETARAFPGYLDGAVERGKAIVKFILQEKEKAVN